MVKIYSFSHCRVHVPYYYLWLPGQAVVLDTGSSWFIKWSDHHLIIYCFLLSLCPTWYLFTFFLWSKLLSLLWRKLVLLNGRKIIKMMKIINQRTLQGCVERSLNSKRGRNTIAAINFQMWKFLLDNNQINSMLIF